MKTEEAIKAQIMTAVRDYERYFDQKPRGIWLPECGYTPGIDRILRQAGIQYFFTDSTAVAFASPQPARELSAPLMTPYGVSAFPLDPESTNQVRNAENGYPGDLNYREYQRLPIRHTGFKYYRNTGKGSHKEPYQPELALEKTAEHADHFLAKLIARSRQFIGRTLVGSQTPHRIPL